MGTYMTELVFILDKSGSMSGLESDTIGGFNSLLNKQKGEPGKAIVTTVLFNDQYRLLHDRIDIRGVQPITERDYSVGGSTALLDAVGRTLHKMINVQRYTSQEQRANKVMFAIITDGMENASREYSYEQIRGMIEHQKKRYGWEFIFLGANIDAVPTAGKLGIDANRAADYHADSYGTALNFTAVSEAASDLRIFGLVGNRWRTEIDTDYASRNKNGRK